MIACPMPARIKRTISAWRAPSVSSQLDQPGGELNVHVSLEGLRDGTAVLRRGRDLLKLRVVDSADGGFYVELDRCNRETTRRLLDRARGRRLDLGGRRSIFLQPSAQRHAEARRFRRGEKLFGI